VNNATTPLRPTERQQAPGSWGPDVCFVPTDRRVSPYLYAATAVSGFQVIGS
jgi:hypothetical protein